MPGTQVPLRVSACRCQRCEIDRLAVSRAVEAREPPARPPPTSTPVELEARLRALEARYSLAPAGELDDIRSHRGPHQHDEPPTAEPGEPSVSEAGQLEEVHADLAGALDDLAAVVRILWRDGGYMAPVDQVAVRSAMARLVAHGRSVEG